MPTESAPTVRDWNEGDTVPLPCPLCRKNIGYNLMRTERVTGSKRLRLAAGCQNCGVAIRITTTDPNFELPQLKVRPRVEATCAVCGVTKVLKKSSEQRVKSFQWRREHGIPYCCSRECHDKLTKVPA